MVEWGTHRSQVKSVSASVNWLGMLFLLLLLPPPPPLLLLLLLLTRTTTTINMQRKLLDRGRKCTVFFDETEWLLEIRVDLEMSCFELWLWVKIERKTMYIWWILKDYIYSDSVQNLDYISNKFRITLCKFPYCLYNAGYSMLLHGIRLFFVCNKRDNSLCST
jgi:hypothetical protein